jgi:hypothetical protein
VLVNGLPPADDRAGLARQPDTVLDDFTGVFRHNPVDGLASTC